MKELIVGLFCMFLFIAGVKGCGEEQTALNEEKSSATPPVKYDSSNKVNNSKVKSSGNVLAKNFGVDNGKVELPPNMKLILVTWKGNSMWVLYRPMREGESAEKYTYQEDSVYGLVEGSIDIIETKSKE